MYVVKLATEVKRPNTRDQTGICKYSESNRIYSQFGVKKWIVGNAFADLPQNSEQLKRNNFLAVYICQW